MANLASFRSDISRGSGVLTMAPLALDALSAALAKRVGFDAVYLGGGGLGYARAVTEALLTATEVAEATRAITERVDVNVIVDGGIGFGDAVHMDRTIRLIEGAGAAGIEIEDQVAPKRVHHHKGVEHLIPGDEMAEKIRAAVDARKNPDFAIIARCNAISHEGGAAALQRGAAYAEAGADLLMFMPRNDDEFAAISAGSSVPLAAMTIGPGRPKANMIEAGVTLEVDPMSGTVLAFRALKQGYERLLAGEGLGMDRSEVMDVIHEVGETIGINDLYAIEEHTTERPSS